MKLILHPLVAILHPCLLVSGKGVGLLSILLLPLFFSCSQAEQTYSSHRAYFVFQNAQVVPQLNSAMNGLGEFCTVVGQNNQWVFSSPGIRQDYIYERTELDRKSGYILGLNGLIVGTPVFAEQLSDQTRVVCFDLACPNCYEEASITRAMTLHEGQKTSCGRCGRTYDLNNLGVSTTGGTSLFRYHVGVSNNTLVVSSQR